MRIVSDNSDEDLRRAQAKRVVEQIARELAANLMRITRGAGKPYIVVDEALSLAEAAREFREAWGVWPHNEIAAAIALPDYVHRTDLSDADFSIEFGKHQAVRGALQFVASTLLDQKIQVRSGESDLMQGMREVERGREMNRQEWQASQRRPRANAKSARKKPPAPRKP
jgi:hypothetical protein